MNSLVLPPSGLTGIHFAKLRHAPSLPKKSAPPKRLISAGVGLVLSLVFYWVLLNKGLVSAESPKIPTRPDQAVYHWVGFYRVAPGVRP